MADAPTISDEEAAIHAAAYERILAAIEREEPTDEVLAALSPVHRAWVQARTANRNDQRLQRLEELRTARGRSRRNAEANRDQLKALSERLKADRTELAALEQAGDEVAANDQLHPTLERLLERRDVVGFQVEGRGRDAVLFVILRPLVRVSDLLLDGGDWRFRLDVQLDTSTPMVQYLRSGQLDGLSAARGGGISIGDVFGVCERYAHDVRYALEQCDFETAIDKLVPDFYHEADHNFFYSARRMYEGAFIITDLPIEAATLNLDNYR